MLHFARAYFWFPFIFIAAVQELKQRVSTGIAKFAVPDEVVVSDALPKTRAGKIMRRILRKVAAGGEDGFGDVSTLADPAAVEAVVQSMRDHRGRD
jgi:acetyl-CoA synthetase